MSKLYAVATKQKSNQQEAREAVQAYRDKHLVREGKGMRWMPAWFSFWWKAFVIRPAKGEIQRRLYG